MIMLELYEEAERHCPAICVGMARGGEQAQALLASNMPASLQWGDGAGPGHATPLPTPGPPSSRLQQGTAVGQGQLSASCERGALGRAQPPQQRATPGGWGWADERAADDDRQSEQPEEAPT